MLTPGVQQQRIGRGQPLPRGMQFLEQMPGRSAWRCFRARTTTPSLTSWIRMELRILIRRRPCGVQLASDVASWHGTPCGPRATSRQAQRASRRPASTPMPQRPQTVCRSVLFAFRDAQLSSSACKRRPGVLEVSSGSTWLGALSVVSRPEPSPARCLSAGTPTKTL